MAPFRVNLFHWRRSLNQFQHWRIIFVLFLIVVISYPYTPTFSLPPLRSRRTPRAEIPSVPGLEPKGTRHLWSYIKDYAQQQKELYGERPKAGIVMNRVLLPETTFTWEWINSKRLSTAPSAKGLVSQGAKASLRTNLRSDRQYYMGFMSSGWNNEVIDTANSIYIAILSKRIPILMAFEAHHEHLGGQATTVAVGEIFDLAYLSSVLKNLPIVEAHELKIGLRQAPRLQQVKRARSFAGRKEGERSLEENFIPAVTDLDFDQMSCWKHKPSAGQPLYLPFREMKLYQTIVPRTVLHDGIWEKPSARAFATFLKDYRTGEIPADSLELMGGIEQAVPPDQHLACMDNNYFMQDEPERGGLHDEWRGGYGVWHQVGQYMRFQPALQQMADDFLRDLFGVAWQDPLPVYMTVHIRRGDFTDWFKKITPSMWAHKICEILYDLRDRMGISIEHVVVATDETNEDWLEPLRIYGFHIIDHKKTNTAELLDNWFPTLIDNVILGSGKAFLGVAASTMSILGYRRTIDWNSGFGYFLHSADHKVPKDWVWHISELTRDSQDSAGELVVGREEQT